MTAAYQICAFISIPDSCIIGILVDRTGQSFMTVANVGKRSRHVANFGVHYD